MAILFILLKVAGMTTETARTAANTVKIAVIVVVAGVSFVSKQSLYHDRAVLFETAPPCHDKTPRAHPD